MNNSSILPPGITPLCGWDWVRVHQHDLDGWTPHIELKIDGSRFKFSVQHKDLNKGLVKSIMEGG